MQKNKINEDVMKKYTEEYNKYKKYLVDNCNMNTGFENLENSTEFLIAPATAKHYNNFEFGLMMHSVDVIRHMLKLNNSLKLEISNESIIKVGMFHDVYKAGFNNCPYFVDRIPTEKQKKYGYGSDEPYSINPERLEMGNASSIYILGKLGVDLTEDEAQAIIYKDGQYIESNRFIAFKESKLMMLLQQADIWCARFVGVISQ